MLSGTDSSSSSMDPSFPVFLGVETTCVPPLHDAFTSSELGEKFVYCRGQRTMCPTTCDPKSCQSLDEVQV
jgi:hypothetical protein